MTTRTALMRLSKIGFSTLQPDATVGLTHALTVWLLASAIPYCALSMTMSDARLEVVELVGTLSSRTVNSLFALTVYERENIWPIFITLSPVT